MGLLASITIFSEKFSMPARLIACSVTAPPVARTNNSPNCAVSAKLPTAIPLFASINYITSSLEILRVPTCTWCPSLVKVLAST